MAARFGEETPNLQPEIIFDILKFLPVKSLLKFRCVSKSWRSLISSSSFVKSHLEAAQKDSTFTSHRFIFAEFGLRRSDVKQSSLRSVTEQPSSIDAVTIHYPGEHPILIFSVVGTHGGLICLNIINRPELLFWNPATRAQSTLSTVQFDLKPGFMSSSKAFGFGYSKATEDYRVLGFFEMCERDGGRNSETVLKMYSQKANSWKTIEGYKYGLPLVDSAKFVNGKFYFTLQISRAIVSVDLDSETIGVREPPDYEDGFDTSIGVLGDCVCFICPGSNQNQQDMPDVDIWVLKEYDSKESWTKLLRIQLKDDAFVRAHSMIMLPNGEILLTLLRVRFHVYGLVCCMDAAGE